MFYQEEEFCVKFSFHLLDESEYLATLGNRLTEFECCFRLSRDYHVPHHSLLHYCPASLIVFPAQLLNIWSVSLGIENFFSAGGIYFSKQDMDYKAVCGVYCIIQ